MLQFKMYSVTNVQRKFLFYIFRYVILRNSDVCFMIILLEFLAMAAILVKILQY